ncbi:ThiF family protein [Drepanopeziza brunnea f. sp. 'multigermtubi' MB_m1]|uniref:NEDD8-activating enzyme E1 regulatory subunit n=1 Tax=Marssonina brunnea f. sp. multigermtubi (strain MB_m1) TaxID=1072389 RepID=K1Y978_MARBU|nr:ThiF family protein [Drepanopeziza brunnea f. sp. 'multigermtubi' MB_m1]EKD21694.1 ThiF family protein [Drepanopeziza brunnea f. sp. 'multigermtubi' MB_m1]
MTEVITDQVPPILHGPSEKEKKYDRQLRLWAAAGQQALEDAHLLLLNSGAGTVGVETLKNLVLPGIGKFTIADSAVVGEADLGVNFFLDQDSLGKSRAASCAQLLQELNPDVKGDYFTSTNDLPFDAEQKYTLIMYTNPIKPETLELVQKYALEHKVPLVVIQSAGFYSYFQTVLPGSFPIVDTHPDSTATTDLRLLTPWAELSAFVEILTKDLENQPAHEHGHIPYIVLLLYFLAKWKEEHGSFPSTYKEKTAFRKVVSDATRTNNPEGGEENFEEAVSAVLKTVSAPSLSSAVKEVFEYKPNEVESKSSFWIIAAAIKRFYEEHKELPLPGSVPDMKAQSTVYVKLQNIYKAKARQDVAEVLAIVRGLPGGEEVDAAEVESFCKNAAFIKLIYGTEVGRVNLQDIASKYLSSKLLVPTNDCIEREFENDENAEITMMPLSLLPIYLSLTATAHAPSATSSQILATIDKTIPDASLNPRVVEIAQEVARAKGGELHNISALTGGMVAQEVIKIITKQYIPIDNTCIFDGITSRTQVLRI